MANINCPNCGKEISDDIKFCKYCGTPIMQINKTCEKDIQGKQKNSKKILIAIIAVLVAIIIALSGILIFNKVNDKSNVTQSNTEKQVLNNDIVKPNNNKQDDNIHKAPDGKYYVPVKITTYNFDGAIVDLVWNENSVVLTDNEGYSSLMKFNGKGQLTSDDEVSITYQNNIMSGFTLLNYNAGGTAKVDSNGNITNLNIYSYLDEDPDIPGEERYENNIEYKYDSQGRLIESVETLDYGSRSTKYTYISEHEIEITRDPDRVFKLYYNDFGKISEMYEYSVKLGVDYKTYFEYDENQNVKKITFEYVNGGEVKTAYFEITWQEATKEQAIFSENEIISTVYNIASSEIFVPCRVDSKFVPSSDYLKQEVWVIE